MILDHFPYDTLGKPRPAQAEALERIQAAVEAGTKTIALEAPTGTGKTAIARTMFEWLRAEKGPGFGGAYVSTASKVLQDQYLRDIPYARTYKGSTSFCCESGDRLGQALKEGMLADEFTCKVSFNTAVPKPRGANMDSDLDAKKTSGYCEHGCAYTSQRDAAVAAAVTIFNHASFLYSTAGGFLFGKRGLLVLDEAHKAESYLYGFVSVMMSTSRIRFLKLDLTMRDLDGMSVPDGAAAILAQVAPKLVGLTNMSNERGLDTRDARRLSVLEDVYGKVKRILKDSSGWVKVTNDDKLEYKPVYVSAYADRFFKLADINLLMSATLSQSVTVSSLGLSRDSFSYITVPSTFPIENRRIYTGMGMPMGKRYIDDSLPHLALCVHTIVERRPEVKGIIHTGTYKVQKFLEGEIGDMGGRLLYCTAQNKEKQLHIHESVDRPTVLVSPSLIEGIDLKHDLSRMQVICKVPYKYMGDEQVSRRMKADPEWYQWEAAAAVVQAYGRSVRSEDDFAETFVLDESLARMIKRYPGIFPGWFLEAVTGGSGLGQVA